MAASASLNIVPAATENANPTMLDMTALAKTAALKAGSKRLIGRCALSREPVSR
jgi:hypothetical protein